MVKHAGPPEGAEFVGPAITIGLDPKYITQAKEAAAEYTARELGKQLLDSITKEMRKELLEAVRVRLNEQQFQHELQEQLIRAATVKVGEIVRDSIENQLGCCHY